MRGRSTRGYYGTGSSRIRERSIFDRRTHEILGRDDRKILNRTIGTPYSAVCRLLIHDSRNRPLLGTAWLVTSRLLITAGHCIFGRNLGDGVRPGRMVRVAVLPGGSQSGLPAVALNAQQIQQGVRLARDWFNRFDPSWDVGCIRLPNAIPAAGRLQIGAAEGVAPGTPLIVVGFQANDPQRRLIAGPGQVTARHGRHLLYNADTVPGTSGGPVLAKGPGGQMLVVGLHNLDARIGASMGLPPGNVGLGLDDAVRRLIGLWMEQFG